MSASFERQVFEKLKEILTAGCTWANHVDFEVIKLAVSDFKDTQLPAIQFWFDEEPFDAGKSQRGHRAADIRITIEVILKPTFEVPITQGDLLDRLRDIREVLGQNIQLSIQGQMWQTVPIRATRDFVTQTPYMIGQLAISVTGQVPYGTC